MKGICKRCKKIREMFREDMICKICDREFKRIGEKGK